MCRCTYTSKVQKQRPGRKSNQQKVGKERMVQKRTSYIRKWQWLQTACTGEAIFKWKHAQGKKED